MFSGRWMATFEGLCRNPAKSKMAGSNWLQTDEAIDVIFCDLHAKKGVRANLATVKVGRRCKNAGSCVCVCVCACDCACVRQTEESVTLIIDCHVLFYSGLSLQPLCKTVLHWKGVHFAYIYIYIREVCCVSLQNKMKTLGVKKRTVMLPVVNAKQLLPLPSWHLFIGLLFFNGVHLHSSSSRGAMASLARRSPAHSERLGRRWQFIVANRQSRGFTPQVNEWLSAVISPNTDYQMFFKERHWNTWWSLFWRALVEFVMQSCLFLIRPIKR